MAIDITQQFLEAIKINDVKLQEMGFHFYSSGKPIFLQQVIYKSIDESIEFALGPPDWHVLIFVENHKGKFGLEDFVSKPLIMEQWELLKGTEQSITAEVDFFVKLLKFALPILSA
jgi:hypothetical protein